ncbi:MAG: phytanoyl-CoA dioxygenase family protein [Actinomycetota bacterium]|nr:phytanoyl-CoA dioxygenase family protein [Actinomycetota bacterium]
MENGTLVDEVLSRDEYGAAMADYVGEAEQRARAAGNRGPLRFDDSGNVHPEILEAYWKQGFYIFEGVVSAGEVDELRDDVAMMIERAPVRRGADVDRQGRPALGRDYALEPYVMIRPLSDPWGGTNKLGGRHPSKMVEPVPDADAPDEVPYLMFGCCQAMPAFLRLYGHPQILSIAAAINGPDFVPFNDAVFVKQPGLGGSVAWHQDGVTHWDAPNWDSGIHGFNFQVQLYRTTAANALWVVPGTHELGRIDIKAKVAANAGSDMLPDAIPLLCEAGDLTIVSRQMLHGSFANTSPDPRISMTFGFHRRSSVLGVEGKLTMADTKPGEYKGPIYDEQRIFERSAVIAVAIDARRQRFVDEEPFRYQPFIGREDEFRYNDETFDAVIRDYNTRDVSI